MELPMNKWSRRMLLLVSVLAAVAVVGGVSREAAAIPAPIEMNFACALQSNGLMRYVSNLNQCKKTEEKVTIKPGLVSVCVQPDGTTRKIPPYQCKKPGFVVTLPPTSGTVYFCAANTTGVLRYVTSPAECTATEFPVFVSPNSPPPVANDDGGSDFVMGPAETLSCFIVTPPGYGCLLLNDTAGTAGDTLAVYSVNGSTANVGTTITLASGALLTVPANGAFTYCPCGAFRNGGQDSFTYNDVESNGLLSNTATVSITIISLP
jgi:large repetitive protein